MSTSPAGWFPQEDGRLRYWDGQQWTDQFAPQVGAVPGPGPVGMPPAPVTKARRPWFKKKRVVIPATLLALVIVGSAINGGGDSGTAEADSAATAPTNSATGKAAAATKPATPAKAPKQAGVGTTVRDGRFEFVVTSVKCGIAKVGNSVLSKEAQGQYCAVSLTIVNMGDRPQMMFADNQYGFDAQARKFSADSEASIYDDRSQVLWEEINPGNQVKGNLYFDIPKGANLKSLELHDSAFSGGVEVRVG